MRFVRSTAILAISAILAIGCQPGFAQDAVEQFYKGRVITIRAPSAPGGINDLVSRLVARHLREYIPGHPNIIVQNLPGSGLAAANTLYNTVERNGTVIAFMERATAQSALQGDPNALFDPLKLTWLGSISSYANDAYMLIVNASHPVRGAGDLRKPGISVKLGGQHSASTNTEFALIAKLVLGLNIDVVRGYSGAAPMFLAMQRGEIDGQVIGLSALRAGQPHLWDAKLIRPLVQFARNTRLAALGDVPTGQELATDAGAKTLIEYAETPFHMALPFAAPPGIPRDRAQALQTAFMAMTKDREFAQAAQKMNLDISPIDGDAVREILARSAATPKETVARLLDVVGRKSTTQQ